MAIVVGNIIINDIIVKWPIDLRYSDGVWPGRPNVGIEKPGRTDADNGIIDDW